MSETIIDVSHLYKSYGSFRAVSNVSFRVQKSSCVAFLGPNGAGKTTIMKTLYGRATPDAHSDTRMRVFDFDPRTQELNIKARTGVVPQEDNLDVELNVAQNLSIYAAFYGLSRSFTEHQIDYLLEFMELGDRRKAKVRELSGGMQRRLIIARALLNNPELLILDEPTTGLDPQVRQVIWDKLHGLKRNGTTILLTTHYMDEAYQLADDVIIMDKGESVMAGTPRGLLEEHMESHVFELTAPELADSLESSLAPSDVWRREDSSARILYYCSSQDTLTRMTHAVPAGRYIVRPVNLEDLFIHATGRRLNELQ
ncbi:MAG: ABC transporter ATP-binding protein [Spirochaetaceae bacterium]|nr:MAG: ABC transporter ATP-binding protein [Spirochaetaceae bacterium]